MHTLSPRGHFTNSRGAANSSRDMAEVRVMEEGLFFSEWTAQEELKLLESIDEYGYGNWTSVAAQVGKDAEDCRSHYDQFYLCNPHPALPVLPIKCEEDSFLAVGGDPNEPVLPFYPGTEISGYMPHRGDFTVEVNNDAEEELTDLNIDPEDSKVVIALKLSTVKIYCWRLRQRAYWKSIVREYGLLDIRKQLAIDQARLNKKQFKLKQQFRSFMRFMCPETAGKVLQSLYTEVQLCKEIRKLQEYRSNGITTLRGGELYEKLLARRKQVKEDHEDAVRRECAAEEALFYHILQQKNLLKPQDIPKRLKEVKKETPLDIKHCIGIEKLSPDEKEVCAQCRLQPKAFLQYKQVLVSCWKQEGALRLADARKVLKIDVNKTRKIYNFLVEKGLIQCP